MYQYCRQKDLAHLWAYLWTNWYGKKNWNLFARSSYLRAMPIARTTMIIESHWRVLKYNYKYNYNMPCLDHLNYIITDRLVPDMMNTWKRYGNNRAFPSWWSNFKSDWKKGLEKNIDLLENYHIDTDKWICSCAAYLNSPYLICKHLIQAYMINHPNFFPQYASTIRRHDYPFIYFGCENLPRINLINSVWNNTQPNSSNVLTIVPEMSEGSIRTRFDVIERRKAEWEMDKKTFESLMTIVGQNLENDNFYNELGRGIFWGASPPHYSVSKISYSSVHNITVWSMDL